MPPNKATPLHFAMKTRNYIQNFNLKNSASLFETNLLVNDLVLKTKSKQWELQGRALLLVAD